MNNNEIPTNHALVNITWKGQNGDLVDPIFTDSTDGDVFTLVTEAVQHGDIPGITQDMEVDFKDFVVDRFVANAGRPWNLISIRPKTPFGA